jgi:integrase
MPKTRRSKRTVALPAFAVEALRRRRAEQRENRLLLGMGREDGDGVVFTRAGEEPWHPSVFGNAFGRTMRKAGIACRLHDLRHSFATLMLASGTDLKTVSTALGHSAIGVTANTYLHAVDALEADAAARLDVVLRGAAPRKT